MLFNDSLLSHTKDAQVFLCGSEDAWGPFRTDRVDFTQCFEEAVILIIPSVFYFIFGASHLTYLIRNLPSSSISSKNGLYYGKVFFGIATLLVQVAQVVSLVYFKGSFPVMQAQLWSAVLGTIAWALAVMTVFVLHAKCKRTSYVLSFYMLFATLAVIPKFRSYLIDSSEVGKSISPVDFYLYMIFCPLVWIMFLLTSFAEPKSAYKPIPESGAVEEDDTCACPEKESPLFSRLTFWWMSPLLFLGYSKPLVRSDLWNLNREDRTPVLSERFDFYWKDQIRKGKVPSLLKTLILAFGKTFFVAGFFKAGQDVLAFVSPQILKMLIQFTKDDSIPSWKGYMYAAALFVTALVQSVMLHQYFHRCFTTGMRLRSALVAAVYEKSLRLTNSARQDKTVGEIVNLMSVDAQRFMDLCSYLHMLWSAPLQMVLSIYFLFNTLGPSVFAGLSVMVLMIPLNAVVAMFTRRLQLKQMKFKDSRIKIMSEILAGIKVIKLYAWEKCFLKTITGVRGEELNILKNTAYLNAFSAFSWTCAPFLVSLATFACYVLTGGVLTADKAFVSLSLFNLLQFPLSMLPFLVNSVVEASVSLVRLQDFLNKEELDPNNVKRYLPRASGDSSPKQQDVVYVKNGTFSWMKEGNPCLRGINLSVRKNQLTAIVGKVGSGKSSLLACLLGDLEKLSGDVFMRGSVAYVAQQAWIQNATLKDNILFGKPYNATAYQKAIYACALKQDLKMLPGEDMTEIGEKGINLSGGQKQRVALARAVYQDADIYILDDPLSAVDSHVGKHIFDKVIGPQGVLKDKVRILVTNQAGFLNRVDNIIVMKDGEITEMGCHNDLLMAGGEFSEYLKEYASTAHEEEDTEVEAESSVMRRKSSLIELNKDNVNLIKVETSETGSVKRGVYGVYIQSIGYTLAGIVLSLYIIGQGLSLLSNIWLSHWSTESGKHPEEINDSVSFYLGVYAALGFGNAFMVLISTFAQAVGSIHASRYLHDSMLKNILRSPMSFFDTTPLGRIVNRFSKDIYTIDETIPRALRSFLNTLFKVISIVIVCSYSTPIFLVAVVPVGIMYFYIQRFYVASSRELKRLESTSRSPIYAHFSETLNGTQTIRAYSAQREFVKGNAFKVDENQVAYYPNVSSNRWLAIRLEFIGNLLVIFAAVFAVMSRDTLDPGLVGLSISYAMSVTQSLNWMVRMSSDLETNIVAVERVKEYTDTPVEAPEINPNFRPNRHWPSEGTVEFKNYNVRYREGLSLVLRNVSCNIKSSEKVGICGRTGAGKSSLTMCLFRIIEAASGSITIDGVDISQIGLEDLRSKLTIIPQDPVLFSGTLRENLDPFNQYDDAKLWYSLEHSNLKHVVKGLEGQLEHTVAEGGENFSVGQRQLICLARALLRKTKILILDEATAAIDLETDDLIQETIRREFADCTIITIAHRLNTILDCDRILVLDKGRIAEFETPKNLLANTKSIFYGMAKDAGLR